MRNSLLALGLAVATPACIWAGDEEHPSGGGGGGGGSGSGSSGSGSGSGSGTSNGPCGEPKCSPKTPDGLDFAGTPTVVPSFPNGAFSGVNRHIAVGGTHSVVLEIHNTTSDFTLPYEALSGDTSLLVIEETEGPNITLRGLGSTAYLRIVDPATNELYDRSLYASSPLSRAVPVGIEEWITTTSWLTTTAGSFAFAPGHRRIGLAYLSGNVPPNRLIDTSATLALTGATQLDWNALDIANATVGTHTIAVTVGAMTSSAQIRVTSTADSIQSLVATAGIACFGAYSEGAFISGIPWQFTVDGNPVPAYAELGPNCVVDPNNGASFTVTASAGGQSLTVTTQ